MTPMPHAEPEKMGEPAVNGGKSQHSHFLDHLTSYPLVSDSISTFKKNKYGAKSLQYADQGLTYAKPYLPYFEKPYGYVSPYLARVDDLGEQGLNKIDSNFPIIKEDTEKLRGTIYDNATTPLRLFDNAKTHVFDVYDSEYKKVGGTGVVTTGKTVIVTGLVLSQEVMGYVNSFLYAQKEHVKDAVADNKNES